MKKIVSILLSGCMLLALAACRPPVAPSVTTPDTPTHMQTVTTVDVPFTAVSVPSTTETVHADDGTVVFTKTYQTIAMTHAGQAAADQVVLDFLNRVDQACSNADSVAATAKAAYTGADNWIPYTCTVQYSPTRIDQGVLSLFGNCVTYSGGSHPDRSCVAANYDLVTGEPLTLGSILTHVDVVDDLYQLVLDALAKQKEEKSLRDGFEHQVSQRFAVEESYNDEWYFSNTGLCFYFSPYEIAPYSVGVVIAEVPYESLVGIVADAFFPPEHQVLSGTVKMVPFDSQSAQYAHISELIFNHEGSMYALETDSCVQDLRVLVNDPQTNSTYTAYAALYLNPGDAVVLQCDAALLDNIQVQYLSNGQTVTLDLQ